MSSIPIDLRISNIEPPNPEPKRTTYMDLVNLPDPVKFGWTIRYFNYDDVTLYFKVTGQGTGYTFEEVALGSLASGANAFNNLDQFASRAKPASEVTDAIKLILRAYTDAGYTNLKWTFELETQVVFIKSNDPSYTVDVLNNFDDGTVQGWASLAEEYGWIALAVTTDYVLSTPYSIQTGASGGDIGNPRVRIYKSFTTPDKDVVYAIIDLRVKAISPDYAKFIRIDQDTNTLVFLGKPLDTVVSAYIPQGKWIRIVVLLPRNITLELRIIYQTRRTGATGSSRVTNIWMDDFKIISKNL